MKYTVNAKISPKDNRDYIFTPTMSEYNDLPVSVSLKPYAREIENQLSTNSCVANALVSALELSSLKHNKDINLSRLFLYYNLREPYANLKDIDGGAYLRDGFKSISNLGICEEDVWDFTLSNVNIKPSDYSYSQALNHKVNKYERVIPSSTDTSHVTLTKVALAKGLPVVATLELGRSFFYLTGDINTHNYIGVSNDSVSNDSVGYHAMCVVGYDDVLDGFIVENSWGTNWGDGGFCLIKYDVFLNDCYEAWVCTGFDNIIYDEDWSDNSPDLILEKQFDTIIQYKEVGSSFTLSPKILSGVEPLSYEWSLASGSGIFSAPDNNKPTISFIKDSSDTQDSIIQCKVIASDPLNKQATCYYILKYIDEYEIQPAFAFIDDELNISIDSLPFAGDMYDVILSWKQSMGGWVMSSIIEI